MKSLALAAALAIAMLLLGSLTVPAQAGPYWDPGGGSITGGM